MALPQIGDKIAELKKEMIQRTKMTADNVLRELSRIAFSDPRMFYNSETGEHKKLNELNDEEASAVDNLEYTKRWNKQGILIGSKTKVTRHNKIQALKMLGAHLGICLEAGSNISVNNAVTPGSYQEEMDKWRDVLKNLEVEELEQIRELYRKAEERAKQKNGSANFNCEYDYIERTPKKLH